MTAVGDVTALGEAIEKVSRDGYCRLRNVYPTAQIDEALERVQEWYERSKGSTSVEVPFLNRDQPTVYSLQNKDMFFLKMLFEAEAVQGVLVHFLNDSWYRQIPEGEPNYILRSYVARSSNKRLPMHIDSFVPYQGSHPFIMQGSIILQDQSAENGCTIVVPGSHLSGEYTTQEAAADAIPLESQKGDVVIWDSRLWHGTTENASGGTRWAMIATFCRWWVKQHFNIPYSLPQDIYAQLTDSQKAVLGFCSIPPLDETERIDLKSGYEGLLPDVSMYRERIRALDQAASSA